MAMEYSGKLRNHRLSTPKCIEACDGIVIFGKKIKSLVFSTDAAIISNIDADAVLAFYPFTPQPRIVHAAICAADMPVFVGVGGGYTSGDRSVQQAIEAENIGCFGVILNAPIRPKDIRLIKEHVDIPVFYTVVSANQEYGEHLAAGADFLNVCAAEDTPEVVRTIREKNPDVPVIASGGPTEQTIMQTISAGANAISFTPPTTGEIYKAIMKAHRMRYKN